MQNDPLFIPAPFFMVRVPTWAVDDFFKLTYQTDISDYLFNLFTVDELLREAIAIASPTLYEAVCELTQKSKKEKEQITSSLLKYVLRTCSRATPFGLFSCVSLGSWDSSAAIRIDDSKIEKRARPDMEWFLAYLEKTFSDPNLSKFKLVKANPLMYQSRGRVFINYTRKKRQNEKEKTISIRSTFLTEEIFEIAEHPISVEELENKILERYPNLDPGSTKKVIKELIDQQFLCMAIFPSLLTTSPFFDFVRKLRNFPHWASAFASAKELAVMVTHYNRIKPGRGEKQVKAIQDFMMKIHQSPSYLQVDTIYQASKLNLPVHVSHELSNAAEVLWKLSYKSRISSLSKYHEKFLEKYGSHRCVPILELLNEDVGLGIPEAYLKTKNEKPSSTPEELEWKRWLKEEWIACIREGRIEIELTDEIVNKLTKQSVNTKAPLSCEIFCEVYAKSSKELNNQKYDIVIRSVTSQAGSAFGRFIDYLGDEGKNQLFTLLGEEEALEPDCIFADSSYIPSNDRLSNVAMRPRFRRFAVDLGLRKTVENNFYLKDIYVGSTGERFYLTLGEQQKELVVTQGDLLNPTYAPHPLRLMRDISSLRLQQIYPIIWDELDSFPFLPRIKYRRTILSLAKWNVNKSILKASDKDTLEELTEKFLKWVHYWDMPKLVFLTEGDNRVLLDITNPHQRREIISSIKKGTTILLVEKLGQEEGEWVQSSRGNHFSEFVVPFIKNKKYANGPSKIHISKKDSTPFKHRWKLPGSEWLYAKLYMSKENQNRFLIQHLAPLVDHFLQNAIITKWFFIRYHDENSHHLRLRFKADNTDATSVLVTAFYDWTYSLLQDGLIKNVQLASYEREIERYGGEILMEYAEDFFCCDSSTAITLLNYAASNSVSLPNYAIGSLSLIDMLRGCGMGIEAQIAYYISLNLNKDDLSGYREWKTHLQPLAQAVLEDTLDKGKYGLLYKAFQDRKRALHIYFEKVLELREKHKLCTPVKSIQNSLIHMHCNRFLGVDRGLEQKARLFSHRTLIDLSSKMASLRTP